MAEKTFPLRVVLSCTTERLLTEARGERDNGISDLYDLLGHMTGDSPFTHQLPRFGRECAPWLLRWFPELQQANDMLPKLDEMLAVVGNARAACERWLEMVAEETECKPEYSIGQIPVWTHESKPPLSELAEMMGKAHRTKQPKAD